MPSSSCPFISGKISAKLAGRTAWLFCVERLSWPTPPAAVDRKIGEPHGQGMGR